MEYETYILVDYENVQDINTGIINDKIKMLIIVGENQKKIPISLIQQTQPFGGSVEWLQIRSYGKKNALDFFIAYFLGFYTSERNNTSKEYIVYSKDTGYDPLIEFLKAKNINVRRIVSFKQFHRNGGSPGVETALGDAYTESIVKITENLKKVAANKRPKGKKGLIGHIKTILKKPEDDIEKVVEEMFIRRVIYEENGHIKYILPGKGEKDES